MSSGFAPTCRSARVLHDGPTAIDAARHADAQRSERSAALDRTCSSRNASATRWPPKPESMTTLRTNRCEYEVERPRDDRPIERGKTIDDVRRVRRVDCARDAMDPLGPAIEQSGLIGV